MPLPPRPHVRSWLALVPVLVVASMALVGCASMRLASEQSDYYRTRLDAYGYAQSCLDVWPDVLALLGSKGYPLQGRDRQYAGQGKEGALASFVDQGSETRAVEGGGLAVRTGWLPDAEGRGRYEVTGNPGQPSGCVVTFTRVYSGTIDPASETRTVDWKIQLELLKKLDPAAAGRIEAAAPKA
jgi:hypothetical protein